VTLRFAEKIAQTLAGNFICFPINSALKAQGIIKAQTQSHQRFYGQLLSEEEELRCLAICRIARKKYDMFSFIMVHEECGLSQINGGVVFRP